MALVPTFNLRQLRDFDGEMRLQQMFVEGGVVAVWKDVCIVDYYDKDEVQRREAEAAFNSTKATLTRRTGNVQ